MIHFCYSASSQQPVTNYLQQSMKNQPVRFTMTTCLCIVFSDYHIENNVIAAIKLTAGIPDGQTTVLTTAEMMPVMPARFWHPDAFQSLCHQHQYKTPQEYLLLHSVPE